MLKHGSRPTALSALFGAFLLLCIVFLGASHGDYHQLLTTAVVLAPGTLTDDQFNLVDDSPPDSPSEPQSLVADTTSPPLWSDNSPFDPPFAPGVANGLIPTTPVVELTGEFALDAPAPNASRQSRFPAWHRFNHAFIL